MKSKLNSQKVVKEFDWVWGYVEVCVNNDAKTGVDREARKQMAHWFFT